MQTTAETGPQVIPREALQEAWQIPSAETSPIAVQLSLQVAMELDSPTANRDAVEFAIGFAVQAVARLTV